MYESHFGFHGQPFQLNPDPAFYFNSRGHGRALAYLQYGVTQSEGFIVITGEIGAGKTTLLRMLLEGLDRQKVLPAQIVSTQLESGELLQAIITAFGIPASGTSKPHLIATLEAFLTALAAQGRHALLIVDEAQNLDPRAVEELRMLSNFQLGNKALLQSFLVGQPELRRILESPSMEQLRQRVTASYHLGPLGFEETQGYVEHRLKHVGWTDRPTFSPEAFDSLYRWTGGVPRRLNRLCNRVLLAAFLDGRDHIDGALVERTAEELRQEIGENDFTPVAVPARSLGALAAREEAEAAEAAAAAAPAPVPAPVAVEAPAVSAEPIDKPVAEPIAEPGAEPLAESATEADPLVDLDTLDASLPEPPSEELLDDVDALLAASARHLEAIEAQVRDDAALDLDAIAGRVLSATPADLPLAAAAVERTEKMGARRRGEVLLCLVDTESGALKLAALVKGLATQADAPRVVLVNPGARARIWPWEQMERLLPSPDEALHLGLPADAAFERVLPLAFERMGRVIDELQPAAVLLLGESEALQTLALCAHRRGLPLVRLEAGLGLSARPALLDPLSELLLAPARPAPLRALRRLGIDAERVVSIPGQLRVDALAAVWSEVSSLRGALMRLGLPYDLDPGWSGQFGAEMPYGLATHHFDVNDSHAVVATVTRLLALPQTDKIVWLMDRAGIQALRMRLAEHADLATRVVLVEGDGPRAEAERDRIAQARVLCREVDSLPDQMSMLRGARWAAVDAGQVMADAAELLGVPALAWQDGAYVELPLVRESGSPGVRHVADQRETLAVWLSAQPAPTGQDLQRELPEGQGGAVEAVLTRLRAWRVRRATEAQAAASLRETVAAATAAAAAATA
ncbi:XrtA/PEP-CTERM system-associated ATPase [Sphaerotilus mobilis]|uniref:Putative secretion ATPase (PEP-CTERM system associated) n=1 Tax=Sphaerotilus mobilis TaxID=47994 RepID=A0A4Q7LGJ6_9BURK|nr:XrtA/PEP-CTERM system-associated ATPase [Sphaerotilus mobilis]RZS53171.1 putative secretion ATPase (PEP-CTERM system associated) [Sphaerotilus mobilis]